MANFWDGWFTNEGEQETAPQEAVAPEASANEETTVASETTDWEAVYGRLPENYAGRNYRTLADQIAARLEGFHQAVFRADAPVPTRAEMQSIFDRVESGEINSLDQLSALGINVAGLGLRTPFDLISGLTGVIEQGAEGLTGRHRAGALESTTNMASAPLRDLWTAFSNSTDANWSALFNSMPLEERRVVGTRTAQILLARHQEETRNNTGFPGNIMHTVGGWIDHAKVYGIQLLMNIPWCRDNWFSEYKDLDHDGIIAVMKQEEEAKYVEEQLVAQGVSPEIIAAVSGRTVDANGKSVQAGVPAYEATDAPIASLAEDNRDTYNVTDPTEHAQGGLDTPNAFGDYAESWDRNPIGTAGATALVGASTVPVYGAVEGIARQTVGGQAAARRAESLAERSMSRTRAGAEDINRSRDLHNGATRNRFEQSAERYDRRGNARVEHGERLNVRADRQAHVAEGRSQFFESNGAGRAAATELGDKPGILGRLRGIGRWAGDGIGTAIDGTLHHGARFLRGMGGLPARIPEALEAVSPRLAAAAPVLGRVVAPAAAAYETGSSGLDLVQGIRHDDDRRTQRGAVGLGTIFAAGAAGATYGAMGGTVVIPGLGTIAGFASGFVVGAIGGGIATLATRPISDAVYDASHREQEAPDTEQRPQERRRPEQPRSQQPATASFIPEADQGLQAAAISAHVQTETAIAHMQRVMADNPVQTPSSMIFAGRNNISTNMGAIHVPNDAAPNLQPLSVTDVRPVQPEVQAV